MHNFDLKNRTAIVTGGAQGFGYSIVKRFLESGAKVIIWDVDKKFIDIAIKESNSKNLEFQIVDVTNFDQVQKSFEEISSKQKIDIFVNNAGIAGANEKVWNYKNEEWLRVLN
ncbi:MAG: SDR family oxidoreductase, partial [Pelagibacteraceae bacterium]